MLAQLYVDSGNSARALDVLSPLLASTRPDSQALQIAGKAELQQGRSAQAEAYFKGAVAANPANAQARTALALTQIAKGDAQKGFTELEELAAGQKEVDADLTLIATYLAHGDFDRALKAVAALEAKAPALPISHALRARVFAQQGRYPRRAAVSSARSRSTVITTPAWPGSLRSTSWTSSGRPLLPDWRRTYVMTRETTWLWRG
ncbi:MAG: tetratricopeptide repeat protein [Betaproteobacteria bacterium]|nr:tetratricopeptide repeat protein [Betaproteobacteria bacterium]